MPCLFLESSEAGASLSSSSSRDPCTYWVCTVHEPPSPSATLRQLAFSQPLPGSSEIPPFRFRALSLRTLGCAFPSRSNDKLIAIPGTPATLMQRLFTAIHQVLCPFFLHLWLLLLCALLQLLAKPVHAQSTPLGKLLSLPSKGLPSTVLTALAICSVSQRDAMTYGHAVIRRDLQGRRSNKHKHHPSWQSSIRRGNGLWGWLLLTLPLQVWAAPEQWEASIAALQHVASLIPEQLEPRMPQDAMATTPEDDHLNCLQREQDSILNLPLENAPDVPIPPLHQVPEVGQTTAPSFEGVCYALAPGYQAEILSITLRPPVDLAAFNHAVRSALPG